MRFGNAQSKILTNSKQNLYDFSVKDYKNNIIPLSKYSNSKVILVVNVASYWGLTNKNYKELQYLYNKYKSDGFNCEIFSFNVLKEAELNANENEKEHVTTYIINKYSSIEYEYDYYCNLEKKFNNIKFDKLHLSLDTQEDYKLLKNIFKNVYLKKNNFRLDDVLRYLNKEIYNLDYWNCIN